MPQDDCIRGSFSFGLAICRAIAAAVACLAAAGARADPPDGERLFADKVWPLLQEHCLPCHGGDPKKIQGEFDMRSRTSFLRGGAHGQSPVTAQADDSPFVRAVERIDDEFPAMPPKEKARLSTEQVALLREWIAAGAPWPDVERLKQLADSSKKPAYDWNAADGVAVATSGGLSPEWTNRKYKRENLWAYQPLKDIKPPPHKDAAGSNPIDAFIGQRLADLGLPPAPRAGRRTLVRRATFDLTGLPPTPEEIAQFVGDPADDDSAWERLVSRLLDSPHYGEQWGRHWLDVVRYADSSGLANDFERGNAWRYRDFVVRAFQADKPYDQFVREQLAGDEIDPRNPEMLVAVGFLRMGPWELTAMEVPKVARQKYLDDVTDSVGQVFLSQVMACARCHDHKFDPLPTRDYYRLQAVFATTQVAERPAAFLPAENVSGFGERRYVEARQQHDRETLARIEAKQDAAGRKWAAEHGLPYVSRKAGLKRGVPEDRLPPQHVGLDTADIGLLRIAEKGLERVRWELERYDPVALSVYSGRWPGLTKVTVPLRVPKAPLTSGDLEMTSILAGGDPFSRRDPVTPGVLSVLPGSNDTAAKTPYNSIPVSIAGRRAALAAWIADARNPLAVRSIVNRVWQWHFGQGLAGNPNNFGSTGKRPTHAELLDYLAKTFVDQGWSIKRLHRLVLSSEAYRRSSRHPDLAAVHKKDPEHSSYAVFLPRRLEAEEIRDAMLSASGELNPVVGGIPARPEINLEAALQPRLVMGTFASAWQPAPQPEDRNRRSLYTLRLRGLRDPMLEVFNQPNPDLCCERRENSTTTPQVFSLLNSAATYDRAVALAVRLSKTKRPPERTVAEAFWIALGRPPTAEETRLCVKHWREMTDRHATLALPRRTRPHDVRRELVEETTGERFAFVEPLPAYADFHPGPELADVNPTTRALADVCLVLLNSNEFVYVY